MSRLLALEWDSGEARVVVASRRRGSVLVEKAFTVALAARDADRGPADESIGGRLAAAMTAWHVDRVETLVAVGRANIELQLLSLPPAPDEELPDLVRFEAMQQFTSLGEEWPLDFFPVDQTPAEPRSVLAAAISPELVEQIQKTCEAAALKPRRLVLRPCAAASLLRRQSDVAPSVRLMIDLLADEADLTVLVEKTVVFMRTVRLPGRSESPEQSAALVGEIRRTMAAAQNQLGGRRVEQIVVCSDGREHAELGSQIEQAFSLPVVLFDPFAGLACGKELRIHPPDHPGRFAPLLGMLADEAAGAEHAIDFLHPRKKRPPVGKLRTVGIAAAAVAAVLLVAVGIVWWQLAALDKRIGQLSGEASALAGRVKKAEKAVADAEQLGRWDAWNVAWLDELRELSAEFPPAEEAKVVQLRLDSLETGRRTSAARKPAASADEGGGRMTLNVYVFEQSHVDKVGRALADRHHTVSTGRVSQPKSEGRARLQFTETVTVRRRSRESYRPDARAGEKPASPAGATTSLDAARPGDPKR